MEARSSEVARAAAATKKKTLEEELKKHANPNAFVLNNP